MVGEQPEVSIRRDEGEDPLSFPALKPYTRVEADVVQQPRILGDRSRESEINRSHLKSSFTIFLVSSCYNIIYFHYCGRI